MMALPSDRIVYTQFRTDSNHPDLTLGMIYSGLAFYADHQEEIDTAIESDIALVDHLRETADPSPLVARLKSLSPR